MWAIANIKTIAGLREFRAKYIADHRGKVGKFDYLA